jgi:hypothetical protein
MKFEIMNIITHQDRIWQSECQQQEDALVAQLAEVSGLGPEGWGFDSLQGHHTSFSIWLNICMVWIIKSDNKYSVFYNNQLVVFTSSLTVAECFRESLLTYLKNTESDLTS